jgi:hypothetical protein
MPKNADTPDPPKRGRPRVDEPGASVSTWLRPGEHDKLVRLAREQEKTISALVRQWVTLKLR